MVDDILEIDNFIDIDVLRKEFNKLINSNWQFTGKSNTESPHEFRKFWFKELIHDPLYNVSILNNLIDITQKEYIIDRIYANGQSHGQCGSIHKDYDVSHTTAKTLLIYMNPEWKPEWGGHTVIQDSHGKYHSILPKPGKAILFSGILDHVGLEPTIHAREMRVTVAFKMREIL